MKEQDMPITTAVRALRVAKVEFTPHFYDYIEHGGTSHAAASLGVAGTAVIKTLVMAVADTGKKRLVLVLMHGDQEVSTKQLARLLGVKTVSPASPAEVEKSTGYIPGGVSPFGTRTTLPVYVEKSILALEQIYINGGKRGFLVKLAPSELTRVLKAIPVQVAVERRS